MRNRIAVLIAVGLLVAACGSGEDSAETVTSATSGSGGTQVDCGTDGSECESTTTTTPTPEPIMGYAWTFEGTNTLGFPDRGPEVATATLTLVFEDGQDVNELHPRYVVTEGTVTYEPVSTEGAGCTYSDPGQTFKVTPDMSPANPEGDQAQSVLIFDTTVTPITYRGILYTKGPDDTVVQDCSAIDPDTYGVNTVNYGAFTTWLLIDPADSRPITEDGLIIDTLELPSEYGYTLEYAITRTK
jgi:hypothetical protein